MPAAASATVRRAVRQAAARSDLLTPGRRLAVALSGGQDSTTLLHALAEFGRRHGVCIVAAHVDHALRAESAADAERAIETARSMGVEAIARRVDVGAYRAGLKRWSVQQAARAARYQALAAMVAEQGADGLAVAHSADDQAETVLLHLLRGAGLAGLRGMALEDSIEPQRLGPPLAELRAWGVDLPSRLRVVRPLLMVPRATTLAYCTELGLPVAEDASNQTRVYTRNRVRLDLLPLLEQFNPNIRTTLARFADLAGEDLAALDALAEERFSTLAQPSPGEIRIELPAWRAESRGIQRRLLRHGVHQLLGTLEDVPADPIEDALDLLAESHGERFYHLPQGIEVCAGRDDFRIRLRSRVDAPAS